MKARCKDLMWRVFVACVMALVRIKLAILTQVAIVREFVNWLEPDLKKLALWFLASFYLALIAFTCSNLIEMVWSIVASVFDMLFFLWLCSYLHSKGRFENGNCRAVKICPILFSHNFNTKKHLTWLLFMIIMVAWVKKKQSKNLLYVFYPEC